MIIYSKYIYIYLHDCRRVPIGMTPLANNTQGTGSDPQSRRGMSVIFPQEYDLARE